MMGVVNTAKPLASCNRRRSRGPSDLPSARESRSSTPDVTVAEEGKASSALTAVRRNANTNTQPLGDRRSACCARLPHCMCYHSQRCSREKLSGTRLEEDEDAEESGRGST